MKKLLFIILCVFTSSIGFAQIPYSKMLNMSDSELKEAKFKYASKFNQFILSKTNTINNIAAFASAMGGGGADIKPHVDDYRVIVQKGKDATSSVSVIFYNPKTFEDIQSWFVTNNHKGEEINLGKKHKITYKVDDYTINLITEKVEIKTTMTNTSAFAKTKDDSYFAYGYEILTSIPPHSKWLEKEKEKEEKRDAKGKKNNNVTDLM